MICVVMADKGRLNTPALAKAMPCQKSSALRTVQRLCEMGVIEHYKDDDSYKGSPMKVYRLKGYELKRDKHGLPVLKRK